ncbi:MAG: SH3 domain-containing protein [Epulopiscium sp.]|nr:SH3 domain-containing protein [Candidatus Epulonipiscium sp.]
MKRKTRFILATLLLVIIALGFMIYKKLPNFRTVTSSKDFEEFEEGQINVVIGEKRISLENQIIIENDRLYLPISFIDKYITNDFFWDELEEILTITNPREMIRLRPNKNNYELNYKKEKTKDKIIVKDDIVYIPYEIIEEKYNIVASYNEETSILVFDDTTIDRIVGITTKGSTKVRVEADIKSPVVETIYKGDELMTYSTEDGWTQVRTLTGNTGYVNEKHISHHREISKEAEKVYEPHPIKKEIPGSIVIAWDQIGKGYEANFNGPKYKDMVGVNVLSPTWLEFSDPKGNLQDKGSKSYVEKAHDKGYQVWPLMSHNFSNSEWTHEILSSTKKRDRVIKQLVDYVEEYNIDGINIDIENLEQKTGPYWVQFMRELYPIMREQGIYVSTDVYVPSPWTIHYNRAEISKSIDYFVIMAYDEHWSGSEEAGSVASLPWVQVAIENTLEEVPEDKVILGVPFYSRLWREDIDEDGAVKLSHVAALGMDGIKQELRNNGVDPVWDEGTGQYYAEYEKDQGLYKAWLEDEKSMESRAKFLSKYNLAGIAGWKLGLESSGTWEVINNEIKNN